MKPEDDLELYQQISKYSDISDDMKIEVEYDKDLTAEEKQNILFPLIGEVKDIADRIIEEYVLYCKNKSDKEVTKKLIDDLEFIIERIDYFNETIEQLYKK
ncbi:MAG: hypothetical protein LBC92_05615 [Rickettsiales bacterium]|jgi:hypothetical protein|nr:hypothetical protein [Rickettsiales bacterium]